MGAVKLRCGKKNVGSAQNRQFVRLYLPLYWCLFVCAWVFCAWPEGCLALAMSAEHAVVYIRYLSYLPVPFLTQNPGPWY